MSKKRAEWNVRLIRSNYTDQKDVFYPKAIIARTLTLDDLIARATDGGGCGLNPETLRAAAQVLLNEAEDCLLEGSAVSTLIGTLTPTVTGIWNPDRTDPEARRQNIATVRYTPGARLKAVLADPLFHEVSGTGLRLSVSDVEDTASHTHNERLTPGRTFTLRGHMLLMNGDLPQRGVYLIDAATGDERLHIRPEELVVCTRKRIIALAPPDLPQGEYLIRVVSQCTTNPTPMKQAAEYTTQTPLKVLGVVERNREIRVIRA
ncbi:DUF4469 domain-containing protein [Bacteroides sp.]|uniref:DUF4469 domain-containing protein n=1 Tax=Bacteroides sp. TaxID=29523 RepID=UPI003AB35C3B